MGIELSLTGNNDGVSAAGSKGLHHGRSSLGGVQDAGPSGFMAFLSQFSGSPLTGGDLADGASDPLADQDAGTGHPAVADATDPAVALTTLDASALLTQMHMSMNNGGAAARPIQPPGARTSTASTVKGASPATPAPTGTALPPVAATSASASTAAATDVAADLPLHLTGAVSPGEGAPVASHVRGLPLSETREVPKGAPTPVANAGEALLPPWASLARSSASSASGGDAAGQIALAVRHDGAPALAPDAAPAQENPLLPAAELHGTTHQAVARTATTALGDAATMVLPADMKTAAKSPGQGGAVDGLQKQDSLQELMQPAAERPVPRNRLAVDQAGTSDAAAFARGNASAVPAAAWAEGLRQLTDAVKTEREGASLGDASQPAPVHKADASPAQGVNFQTASVQAPSGASDTSNAATAYTPEQQIADQVSVWVSQNVQSAELKLDALGKDPVEVSISMSGNEAQVQFRSDTPETRDLLTRAAAQLDTALQREGLVLSGVSVGTSSQNKDKASEAGENARAFARSGQRTGGIEVTEGVRMTAVPRTSQGTVDLFV